MTTNTEKYIRQSDIVTPDDLSEKISVIGCGGIGSWTTLLLAKMGCTNINVYDPDTVELHNTASQFFSESDIGKLKTEALKETVLNLTGCAINPMDQNNEENIDSGIVVFALDSMQRRRILGRQYASKDIYIIDGRMGGLQLELYAKKASEYMDTTFTSEQVSPEPCTARAISFNCAVTGGLIANAVRLFCKDRNASQSGFIFGFNTLDSIKK